MPIMAAQATLIQPLLIGNPGLADMRQQNRSNYSEKMQYLQ